MPTVDEILQSDQTNTEQVVNALKEALEAVPSSSLRFPYGASYDGLRYSTAAWINLFKALEISQTITEVRINDTNQLKDEAIEALITALQNNPNLSQVYLGHRAIRIVFPYPAPERSEYKNNKVVIAKLAHFLENNQSLKKLYLPIYEEIDQEIIASALEKNTTLEYLDISGSSIYNEESMEIWASLLEKNSTITRLNMSHTSSGSKCLKLITNALKRNQNLSHFSYTNNGLDDKAVPLLISLLEDNPALTVLDLRENDIGILSKKKSDKAVQALANVLKKNDTLTSLNLKDNHIGKEGTKALALALEQNNTLEKLDITGSTLDTLAFAIALKQNHTLKYLNLWNTKCDLEMLVEALQNNKGLTELDLGRNVWSDISFEKLLTNLQNTHNLTSLGFSLNHVYDKDLPYFINLLRNSPKLTKLDLKHNNIELKDSQAFFNFLETNQTLTSLDLSNNPIEIEEIKGLINALKKNSTLTELKIEDIGPGLTTYDQCLRLNALFGMLEELLTVNDTITTLKVTLPAPEMGSPFKESRDAYYRIQQALKRNQDLADKQRIKLVSEKIQEAQIVPAVVGNIVAEYAGPPISTESAARVPKARVSSVASKPLSLWARIKEWLGAKWGKLSNIISNALNSFKNKLGLTPKKSHIESSDQSKKMPAPSQTAPLLPEKESLISKDPDPTTSADLTQDAQKSKNQPRT